MSFSHTYAHVDGQTDREANLPLQRVVVSLSVYLRVYLEIGSGERESERDRLRGGEGKPGFASLSVDLPLCLQTYL